MIPKIIHFVWLSNEKEVEYPEDVRECMASWKDKLPDYEIKVWNNDNIDLTECRYAQEALQEEKYAFASDYVRLWALYNYGGIYLDSDVEVVRSFDDLLDAEAFIGLEDIGRAATCVLACEKGNPLFKEFLDDYKEKRFILGLGQYDMTPNPVPITNRLNEHGYNGKNEHQKLDHVDVYPMTYFCPFNPYRDTGECFSENTYAIHHFGASWKSGMNENEKKFELQKKKFERMFGEKRGEQLCRNYNRIRQLGLVGWYKRRKKEREKRK